MPTSEAEWPYVRSYIGSDEEDDVFDERLDRLLPDFDERADAIDAAIEESLRAQLAEMTVGQPTSMSLPGGISASFGQNIQQLAKMLDDFRAEKGTGVVRFSRLVRDDFR